MDPALAPFYARLRDVYSEAEFEARARELSDSFGGLLDAEALGLYLLDEHGRNEGAVVSLADCKGRAEATVVVRVERLEGAREFAREGGVGRVANVAVRDATGGARLTLWDRDAEKTEDGTLKAGDTVKVVNARVKDSKWGLELHVTGWTTLEVEGALDPAKRKLLTDTLPSLTDPAPAEPRQATLPRVADPEALAGARDGDTLHLVRARVLRVRPTRTFRRKDGGIGFVAEVDLEDASGRATVTLWDEAVKAAQALAPGADAELTDLVARSREGRLELHTSRSTRVTRVQMG